IRCEFPPPFSYCREPQPCPLSERSRWQSKPQYREDCKHGLPAPKSVLPYIPIPAQWYVSHPPSQLDSFPSPDIPAAFSGFPLRWARRWRRSFLSLTVSFVPLLFPPHWISL